MSADLPFAALCDMRRRVGIGTGALQPSTMTQAVPPFALEIRGLAKSFKHPAVTAWI